MKQKMFAVLMILAFVFAAAFPGVASAQAYVTSFTTSITYQNVDTQDATSVQIHFYASPDSTTPIVIDRPALAAGAGTSVSIGSLGDIDPNFRGSAIMFADRLLVATLVQVPQSTTVKNRPLSNGFFAGSPQVLLATVLKNQFNTNTIFSVQNTDTEMNTITVEFFNTSASLVHSITQDIEAGAPFYVDAGQIAALGTSFNGSAVISAERADASDGAIVATAMELSTNGTAASAFEGVPQGASTYYMPSALCDAFPPANYRSAYAVQNTTGGDVTVTVNYSNGATANATIGSGAKASFGACAATGMTTGFSGSATITATGDIVAIGKVSGAGVSTAFLGAESGADKLALPYVRWSQTQYDTGARQRTFIAIQNVGSAEIPANALSVQYYDRDGNLVTEHVRTTALGVGLKFNSNPYSTSDPDAAEFGYYVSGFGGSAIVVCTAPGCEVVAVARVQSTVPATSSIVGEDYNGIPVP